MLGLKTIFWKMKRLSLLRQVIHFWVLFLSCIFSTAVLSGESSISPRVFQSGFESVDDFSGFYIVPPNHKNSATHELSSDQAHTGRFAHKGWVYAENDPSSLFVNNNHRAYPTVQLFKLPKGSFKTPVKIEFWVWLDMEIIKGEWFSFATLDHTTTEKWDAVLVNLSDQGFVHLMHVPKNGQSDYIFQTSSIKFPMRQWVKLSVLLHFDAKNGYAKVWQDDQLVSSAEVKRGNGAFTQAHFGLYVPPSISQAVIYNDDLVISEVNSIERNECAARFNLDGTLFIPCLLVPDRTGGQLGYQLKMQLKGAPKPLRFDVIDHQLKK